MKRTPIRRKRKGIRRGRVVDEAYLAWMGQQPCPVCGGQPTVHHVREYGSPKNDRRTIPPCAAHHLHDFGPHSIERMGKAKWQAFHGLDIEAMIVDYNFRYKEETSGKSD